MNFKEFAFLLIISFFVNNVYSQQISPQLLSGLTPAQIKAVQEAYGSNISTPTIIDQEPPAESLQEVDIADVDVNLLTEEKYGYSFFNTKPSQKMAVGDLPLPSEYKISLRDKLTVIMSGAQDAIFTLSVKLDGSILFPEIGAISVVGKTLEEVRDILTSLINQTYVGVDINVSINELSGKKISIVGAVKTPGTYLVNPFTTITSALAYSGGISEIGTLRKIKLIRNDGEIFYFDLYDLLIKGDRSGDITIEAGDTILIDAAEQFVHISGAVRRPAIYEVLESESLKDIVNLSLGFTDTANKNNILVSSLDLTTTSISKESTDDLGLSLENVIAIDVFNYISEDLSGIQVIGAVEEPGFYKLDENDNSLDSLIESLEFSEVYPWIAVLEQFDREGLERNSILFSLKDKKTTRNITLKPNSKLFFFKLNEDGSGRIDLGDSDIRSKNLIDQYALRINHQNQAYSLPIFGLFSVPELIKFLGLDMTNVEDEAIYISPLENLTIFSSYKEMTFEAKKFNTISFRSPVNDLIKVSIEGALFFPGTYTLNSNSTLQDLYDIVGEFKDNAFLDGVIYKTNAQKKIEIDSLRSAKEKFRQTLLINSLDSSATFDPAILLEHEMDIPEDSLGRVSGSFSPNSIQALETILSNGDSILIPQRPNFIAVMGEVLNPLSFSYEDKLRVDDVIKLSGGFSEFAAKDKIYIIRSNGLVEKRVKNIFIRNQLLYPGDTVVVPRKIQLTSPALTALAPITQILSDLAFSAAAIDNLSGN